MIKLTKAFALIACAALIAQASVANAQSQSKRTTVRTQQKAGSSAKKVMTQQQGSSAKKEAMSKDKMAKKAPISRAFTNGYNVPSTGVALEGYCPVCYIAANKAAKGDPKFSYDYKGITYWFVSDPVRKTFAANPEKYVPAYGGWCAVGVAMGQRFPIDPTNFKVVDGRVMFFLRNAKIDGVDIWNKNEPEHLKKADANWAKLKG